MLSCAEFLAEFGDYLEEAASSEVRARLEEHLHECKTCQVIVDSTRKTIRFVTDCDSFTLTADQVEPFVKDVMDRIREKETVTDLHSSQNLTNRRSAKSSPTQFRQFQIRADKLTGDH